MIDFSEISASYVDSVLSLSLDVEAHAEAAFAPMVTRSMPTWAEEERVMPKSSSSEGGPYRLDRVPYQREMMESLEDPRVQTVVSMKGAQVGGSSVGENWTGWRMAEKPGPMLIVWPTDKLLKRWSLTRFATMIEDSPGLRKLFKRSGLRDSDDSIAHKEGPGFTIDLLTARSSGDLRSISAGSIWFSEVDNIIKELPDDGDPIELARSRGETFWDYKEYLESTPTVWGRSRIFDEMMRSDWRDWWMCCPSCGEYQVLRWRDGMENGNVDVTEEKERRFRWDTDEGGEPIPGTVFYVCEHNGCEIPEWSRNLMLQTGEWRPRFPGRAVRGYHIPAWISPLISWTRLAQRFTRAMKDEAKLRTFVNNVCGLPYREKTTTVSAHFLQQRAERYLAPVPRGVKLLLAGGDMQGDHAEILIWGIGAKEEMWAIAWKRIDGDPASARLRREVMDYLNTPLIDEDGRKRYIAQCCYDANYHSNSVHRMAADFVGVKGARIVPIIGRDGRQRPIIADPPAETRRRRRRSKPSRIVGTDVVKDLLMQRLQITERGPEYIHFPEGLDPAFYAQLTSEELQTEYRKKRPVRVWTKKRKDAANEVLDMSVYAYAAFISLGARIQREIGAIKTIDPEEPPASTPAASDPEGPTPLPPAAAPAQTRAPSRVRITRPRVVSKGVV